VQSSPGPGSRPSSRPAPGLKRQRRRRSGPTGRPPWPPVQSSGTPLTTALAPNELWCADYYKGEFLLGNRQYCYPLTVTDQRTRYLLTCEGLESTKSKFAFSVLERTFRDFGLPAAFNFLQQQERFEEFIRVYNHERPHQALGGLYPAEIDTPSARPYEPPRDPEYPFHDRTIRVTRCGRICLGTRKTNLSTSLAEQFVGVREVDDQVWLVSFLEYGLGYFDRDEDRVEPGPNPFAPDTVLTM
jgi:hypothetical protein